MLAVFIIFILIFVLTFIGVEIFRRWSLRRDLLDLPNERSSHTQPTPRGGGMIICLICLTSLLIYHYFTSQNVPWSYFAGAAIIAVVSWFDDLKSISPVLRFTCHAIAGLLIIFTLEGFETIYIPYYGLFEIGKWGNLGTFLWIVWMINAYNFMDGIDGMAATQAVSAGLGWFCIGYFYGLDNICFLGGVLASSALGFLIHNWQPARIFMGDVGSAFLGFSFAVIPLLAGKTSHKQDIIILFPIFAGLLVWFFVFDSVLTFFRRLFKGEKVWQAHRMHIYQELVISGFSHQFVTTLYGTGSFLILLVLFSALKFSHYFGLIILGFVIFLTTVLLIFWQKRKVYV